MNSQFHLRYPLWHVTHGVLERVIMSEKCRAALWYSQNINIRSSVLNGIKAIRECDEITIDDSKINSSEFGWLSKNLSLNNTEIESEYVFFHSSHLHISNLTLHGKYSFQYTSNVEITNSYLDTKDAFWHCNNVTVTDCVVKGEYLGWYSENLKFIRCRIIGTQPLCYAKNLVIENCEMVGCDLAFEKSEVNVNVNGMIDSIKNPLSGHIYADTIGKIVTDSGTISDLSCVIETQDKVKNERCCLATA
jgi:hypothetical protein